MKWRIVVMLTFLLAALAVPVPVLARAERFQFKGESAFASFSSIDPNDLCLQTSTFVTATEGRRKEGPGKPENVSEVFVSIFQFNNCTGEVLLDAFGSVTLSAEAFQVGQQLNAATLQATVEVCDFISGNCFPVEINLTWTGTGEIQREKSSSHSHFGRCKVHFQFMGTFRDAVATGSVTALGINFASAPSDFAQLASVKQGFSEINCP